MQFNKHKGITIPTKAIEGDITIVEGTGVRGDVTVPVVETPVKKGDAVAIVDNDDIDGFVVKKADGTDGEVIIGFVHDRPEFDKDPVVDLTEAEAIATGVLRKVGVETTFVDIRVVNAKANEGIKAGDTVDFDTDGQTFVKAETGKICLEGQTENNTIIIGE